MTDKKRMTHDRIVADAARLFREKGYSACGVDAVMGAAGLTAGGFYSHFKNKDALLAEALRRCFPGGPEGIPGKALADSRDPLGQWVEQYASELHRDNPSVGCAIPTLAAEVARQGPEVRSAFTEAFVDRVQKLANLLDNESNEANTDAAIAAMAAAAGAVLLSRAVSDPELSARILRVVCDQYQHQEED